MIKTNNDKLLKTLEKQNQILEKISAGIELNQVLEAIIFSVEELITNVHCSILFFDQKHKSLINAIGPSLPIEYLDAINWTRIGPFAGSCGTAAFYGETVIVSDISLDPLWDKCRKLPLSFGLRSCWSKPIYSSNKKLLGTFALYYNEPHNPSNSELDILGKFSHLAEIAVEKRQTEDKHQKYELMAENISELLTIIDETGVITYASPSYKSILGFDPEELLGTNSFQYLPLEEREYLQENFKKIVQGKNNTREINIINKDGIFIPFEVTGVPVFEESGEVTKILIVGRDITERKKTENKIKFMAYHDNLTQLPNRLYFNEILQREIDKAKQSREKMAILFLDIDNFKLVNDSIGHSSADEVLKMLANRASYCLSPNAKMARVSGDEF